MDQTLASVNVLVVDNNADVRDVLSVTLGMCGATVTTPETAEQALTILQAWRPAVLISDLQMPGKDGYWLITAVRALTPERGERRPQRA
ncbi:MAG TPA: response regulator [Methylomirabilota bacterium]|jgi:two-component system CheB/CheR fusion protein|nr:response regulator [Methylomirabilota bacterium]